MLRGSTSLEAQRSLWHEAETRGERLRQQCQHVRALQDGEMRSLADRPPELLDDRLAGGEQMRVARSCGEREEAPAEPIGARSRVAVDEAVLGEGLERPRDLALVGADELCNSQHAEPVGGEGLVPAQRREDIDSAPQTSCSISNHSCSIVNP